MSKLTLISHHLCPYVQRAAIAVKRWRKALSERASVRGGVGEDYPQRLMEFLDKHNSILLRLPAAA